MFFSKTTLLNPYFAALLRYAIHHGLFTSQLLLHHYHAFRTTFKFVGDCPKTWVVQGWLRLTGHMCQTDKCLKRKSPCEFLPPRVAADHEPRSPPLSVRLSQQFDNVYNFFGLYFASLLSVRASALRALDISANTIPTQLDPYAAAESSRFNTRGRPNASQNQPRWSSGTNSGGLAPSSSNPRGPGGGGGAGSGRPGGAPRRTMGIDDVRAPECGSCG